MTTTIAQNFYRLSEILTAPTHPDLGGKITKKSDRFAIAIVVGILTAGILTLIAYIFIKCNEGTDLATFFANKRDQILQAQRDATTHLRADLASQAAATLEEAQQQAARVLVAAQVQRRTPLTREEQNRRELAEAARQRQLATQVRAEPAPAAQVPSVEERIVTTQVSTDQSTQPRPPASINVGGGGGGAAIDAEPAIDPSFFQYLTQEQKETYRRSLEDAPTERHFNFIKSIFTENQINEYYELDQSFSEEERTKIILQKTNNTNVGGAVPSTANDNERIVPGAFAAERAAQDREVEESLAIDRAKKEKRAKGKDLLITAHWTRIVSRLIPQINQNDLNQRKIILDTYYAKKAGQAGTTIEEFKANQRRTTIAKLADEERKTIATKRLDAIKRVKQNALTLEEKVSDKHDNKKAAPAKKTAQQLEIEERRKIIANNRLAAMKYAKAAETIRINTEVSSFLDFCYQEADRILESQAPEQHYT